MKISIIVATAQNGVIGRNNQLLWHLPDDLKQFKRLTMGHPIIMGRRTFESIGRVLPGRTSIVITHNTNYQIEGCVVVHSLDAALAAAQNTGVNEAFVIGGGIIYDLALPLTNKIYLTEVAAVFEGDAFFEIKDPQHWQETSRLHHPADEKHPFAFDLVTLERS
jgi:dihydrofolate reductase